MWSLAIDTSSTKGSIALFYEAKVKEIFPFGKQNRHGKALAPLASRLLEENNLSPQDIGLISLAIGPGSFTGLRIGIAFAMAYSYVTQCELVGVPSFLGLAQKVKEKESIPTGKIVVLMDARRNRLYGGIYEVKEGKISPFESQNWLLNVGKAKEKIPQEGIFVGNGVPLVFPLPQKAIFIEKEEYTFSEAKEIGEIGYHLWNEGKKDLYGISPLYLMPTEAEEKLRR